MATVNSQGHLAVRSNAGKPNGALNTERNFFTIKYDARERLGVNLGYIRFPKHLAGKRVRFKVEFVDD